MFHRAILGALCVAGLSLSAHAGTVTVHGSTTVANAVLLPHKSAIEQSSGQNLEIVANGSSRGLTDVANGKSTLGMISAPLDTVVAKVNKKKPGSIDGSALKGHPIGETRVAFVIHPTNTLKNLTLAQVADVLSGKVKNWSAVGGPDAPVVVIVETKGGGVRSMVEKNVLKGGEIAAAKRELPNATQVVKVVSQVPQAIGIAASGSVTDAVHAIETDEQIVQPLLLISKGEPTPEAAKVIEAARAAGS